MLRKLQQNLQKIPDWQNKKYLLAISGGVDSMVLADALQKLGLHFELAHCNFKLRGSDSNADQEFVEKYAKQHKIPAHIKICDVTREKNIQIAARKARYQWFNTLVEKHNFDYILTAHHLDDSIETFFINLLRATGLRGLLGIGNHDKIYRPLSEVRRKEIMTYAAQNQVLWRKDISNQSDKYRRNFIRHHIIPRLAELQPGFYKSFSKTFNYLQQSQAVIDEWFENLKRQVVSKDGEVYILDLKVFEPVQQKALFLFHWLSVYGFTDIEGAVQLLKNQSGKEIFSKEFRLTKHGDFLLLQKIETGGREAIKLYEYRKETKFPIGIKWDLIDRNKIDESVIKSAKSDEIFIDYDLIEFPLTLRKWEAGDYFYPIGLSGKKKLSDYFTNLKLSRPEKEKVWLLCNRNQIIWVVGKRMDERYKITKKTEKILHLQLI